MQQMWRYIGTFLFLTVCSVQDIGRKKISVTVPVLFAVLGIALDLWQQAYCAEYLPGIVLAGSTFLFAKVTQEQIGMGDGLVLLVLSLFLTGKELIAVFLTALIAAAVVSGVLLALRRAGRRSRLAFVPFLTAAFLLQWMLWRR